MELILHLENASSSDNLPDDEDVHKWVATALRHKYRQAELCIRIVDREEGREFNRRYRGKDYATNVLSFPVEFPIEHPLLGDLVICAPVVTEESRNQGKTLPAHWAHMLVHGSLHLAGYDHIEDADAAVMEELESKILAQLEFPDPYQAQPDVKTQSDLKTANNN